MTSTTTPPDGTGLPAGSMRSPRGTPPHGANGDGGGDKCAASKVATVEREQQGTAAPPTGAKTKWARPLLRTATGPEEAGV